MWDTGHRASSLYLGTPSLLLHAPTAPHPTPLGQHPSTTESRPLLSWSLRTGDTGAPLPAVRTSVQAPPAEDPPVGKGARDGAGAGCPHFGTTSPRDLVAHCTRGTRAAASTHLGQDIPKRGGGRTPSLLPVQRHWPQALALALSSQSLRDRGGAAGL